MPPRQRKSTSLTLAELLARQDVQVTLLRSRDLGARLLVAEAGGRATRAEVEEAIDVDAAARVERLARWEARARVRAEEQEATRK